MRFFYFMTLNNKYITLKEAAEISGYAPDYVGQLIRQGKITGRQQYFNVAWVTTEESLMRYIERYKKTGKQENAVLAARNFISKLFLEQNLFKIFKVIYFIILFCLAIFWLMLLYIIFTGIENHMTQGLTSRSFQINDESNI